MPIYEFCCNQCGTAFEELVRNGTKPVCPECTSGDVCRLLSTFAVHSSSPTSAARERRRAVPPAPAPPVAPATDDVIAALDALRAEVEACTRCPLHETRTRAVFGEGDPAADLMFVGEAPGYHEDQQGRPFVGQAGKLLEQLLASIGLTREQVFIANVLKSRPPNNRDPRAGRDRRLPAVPVAADRAHPPQGHLHAGQPRHQAADRQPGRHHQGARAAAGRTPSTASDLYLYPIFHPAAALYTPAMLDTLKQDFLRLPELLAHAAPQGGQAAGGPGAERPAWRPPAA